MFTRFMLETFVAKRKTGQVCRHKNGNKTDNRWPENICWGSPAQNEADKIAHSKSNRGERNGMSKLTLRQVLRIKKAIGGRGLVNTLAKKYCVSHTTISVIRSGINWPHAEAR